MEEKKKKWPTSKNLKKTLVKWTQTDWSFSFFPEKEERKSGCATFPAPPILLLLPEDPPKPTSSFSASRPSSSPHGAADGSRGPAGPPAFIGWAKLLQQERCRGPGALLDGLCHLLPSSFLCLPRPCCCSRLGPGVTLLLKPETGKDAPS